jgi:microsomal dipeptidase-like Zn-dependent dipeptidase
VTPTIRRAPPGLRRRTLLQALPPALALGPFAARAANPVPIADMHSHYGMIFRGMRDSGLAEDMRAQRVALVAWSLPSDLGWIRAVPTGIVQAREPEPGTLAPAFLRTLARMRAYVAATGLKTVLTPADVDACIAGDAGIVLASEGTDFLEGRLESLDAFHAQGLRHVQLVHYIRNPIGDFQTTPPRHGGLSDLGKRLVEACNAKGMLVDLAHSPGPSIDQALAISKLPMVFSHGWVDRSEGSWRDAYGYLRRRLSLEQAKKIAARGGVVGLWGLALGNPGPSRTPGQGNWTLSTRHRRLCPRARPPGRLARRRPRGARHRHRRRGPELVGQRLLAGAPGRRGAAGHEAPRQRDRKGRVRELRPGAEGRALRRSLNQTRGGFSPSVANARSAAGRACIRSRKGFRCGRVRAGRPKPRVQRQSTKA